VRHDAHPGGALKLSHQAGHALGGARLVERIAAALEPARPPFQRVNALFALDLLHAVLDPAPQLVTEHLADVVGYSHRAFLKEAARGRPGSGTYESVDPFLFSLLDRAEEAKAAQQPKISTAINLQVAVEFTATDWLL